MELSHGDFKNQNKPPGDTDYCKMFHDLLYVLSGFFKRTSKCLTLKNFIFKVICFIVIFFSKNQKEIVLSLI
jgi:hypothetical protein